MLYNIKLTNKLPGNQAQKYDVKAKNYGIGYLNAVDSKFNHSRLRMFSKKQILWNLD